MKSRNERNDDAALRMTRRSFVGTMFTTATLLTSAPKMIALAFDSTSVQTARAGIVSFHLDRPYFDSTGTAKPYYRPNGVRSGETAARLSEAEFRSLC